MNDEDSSTQPEVPASNSDATATSTSDPTVASTSSSTSTTASSATTTTEEAASTTTPLSVEEATLHPIDECKLSDPGSIDNVSLDFRGNPDRLDSVGVVNGVVLFADFDDAPSVRTPEEAFALVSPGTEEFFDSISYGALDMQLTPHFEWLRMGRPSVDYADAIRQFEPHRQNLQEAVDLADDDVDFSDADVVILINNPDAAAIPIGPTFTGFELPEGAIEADGALIANGITSGHDLLFWGFLWLPHELGHSLGLPDLYSYDGLPGFTGPFSMMNDIGGEAPEYFAYERWLLDWLRDEQIVCLADGEVTALVEAVERSSPGTKAIMVPLGQTRALVVESRHDEGYDADLGQDGVVVYEVDVSIASGFGPIVAMNDGRLLVEGEELNVEGVQVEVLEGTAEGQVVRVAVG